MKSKNLNKLVSFHVSSYLIVGILTVTNPSQIVVAKGGHFAIDKQHTRVQRLAQFSDDTQQERSQLVQIANTLFNQGDLTGAEENLRKLVKKYPDYPFGYYQLGNVLFRQGKKEDAIKEYETAIKKNSKYALAYNALGVVFASQQRWEQAVSVYQKALNINPNYGDALTNIAQALWEQGNRKEAIASLEKALNIFKSQDRQEKIRQIEQILKDLKAGDDPSIS
ncbi:tetratricopeptide repeat protein [Scytonema sp. UIC 10036]|uniref:tetratricopeptide repeat protein n=1 Tax=Scytonema sp. UIC 10036 TaxID=2304196 RepID=UPI0012DA0CC8|nr:tetratricopeptide repeat protein [Scytonema sp. UIC 10036]MUG95739.1 tetratricopeptide repeat protein [Scytonema sp. UIC 10036]